MNQTKYRIVSYTFKKENPEKYPISLNAEEKIVFSREEMERICSENDAKDNSDANKPPCIYHIEELKTDDSGRVVLFDEEIRSHRPFGNEDNANEEKERKFRYGDVIEVLDNNRLTLGIIVHIPFRYYNPRGSVAFSKPYLFYSFMVLLYKSSDQIVIKDVYITNILKGYSIMAESQIAALRSASENILIRE